MPTQTATTITMPQLGESVTEGTIGNWLKAVGDQVEKYEPLVEVVTDKVNAEIPAPVSGVLTAILVEPETTVPVGAGICLIDESGAGGAAAVGNAAGADGGIAPEAAASARAAAAANGPSLLDMRHGGTIPDEADLLRHRSSPAVRRIAEEHGLDLELIAGTGINGRVTKQDILAYLAANESRSREVEASRGTEPASQAVEQARSASPTRPLDLPTPRLADGDTLVPLTPMRRAIAEHMVRSERTAPHASVVMEVDMSRVVAYRAARKDEFQRREGIELTYLPFAIKAVTTALRDHPRLNAVWTDDGIIERNAINIGVAVGLDDGLVVPVIKHADRLSLGGLMHAIAELVAKARAGSLSPDDVAGGTFTVNNPGSFGSLVSTPILVQPQVAILSTEAIVKRPVVVDDMIAIRAMMNLSLSIDHRALDGLAAARFLQQVKAWLEGVDERLSLY